MWSLGLLSVVGPVVGLNAYGHAYSRPHDFTPAQFDSIATDFSLFTVEKCHAADVYGNVSTGSKAPFTFNSYAASVGTATKLKALNSSIQVLMYWNSAIHFNFYECEAEVQPSWVLPPDRLHRVLYDYSVPAFREWWVRCAVDSIQNSAGALDGLFIDAVPKVEAHLPLWAGMIDEVRAALGPDAPILDNGFYGHGDRHLAGVDAWNHTGFSYTESMSSVGGPGDMTPEQAVSYLLWVANAAATYPERRLVGHGKVSSSTLDPPLVGHGRGVVTSQGASRPLDPTFAFGLAKYLLVTTSLARGWFLANTGSYSIDGGLLDQPMWVYQGEGLGCGEPTAPFVRVGGAASHVLQRAFERGSVTLDLGANTSSIVCGQ
jgi:hypothetical protein